MQKKHYLIFGLIFISLLIIACNGTLSGNISKERTSKGHSTSEMDYGDLLIDSTPSGANVYVDGRRKGTTPVTIVGSTFKSARHFVNMTKKGYAVYSIDLILRPNKPSIVNMTLNELPVYPCEGRGDAVCPDTCSANSDYDCCIKVKKCWRPGKGC